MKLSRDLGIADNYLNAIQHLLSAWENWTVLGMGQTQCKMLDVFYWRHFSQKLHEDCMLLACRLQTAGAGSHQHFWGVLCIHLRTDLQCRRRRHLCICSQILLVDSLILLGALTLWLPDCMVACRIFHVGAPWETLGQKARGTWWMSEARYCQVTLN